MFSPKHRKRQVVLLTGFETLPKPSSQSIEFTAVGSRVVGKNCVRKAARLSDRCVVEWEPEAGGAEPD